MGPLDFTFGLLLLGTVTGIVKMLTSAWTGRAADRAGHVSHQGLGLGPSPAPDHVRALETQLLDARLQNDQLQKQLEWHTKLLETQDRLFAWAGTMPSRPAAGAS